MFKKVIRSLSGLTDKILAFIFILMLLLGSYTMYDSWYVYNHASDRTILAYKPKISEDGKVEEEQGTISDEMVAWLTIDDTNVDYPIMQAEDNMKYIDTDAYGNYSLTGAIFLDFRNSPDFTDEYSLIYGHHMASKQMFGSLDDFKDEEFFNTHRKATLIVNGTVYDVRLFAVCPADASEAVTFNPPLSEGLDKYIEQYAYHWDGTMPKRYIGFSTCMSESTTSRLIVFGYIVNDEELEIQAEKMHNGSPSYK